VENFREVLDLTGILQGSINDYICKWVFISSGRKWKKLNLREVWVWNIFGDILKMCGHFKANIF